MTVLSALARPEVRPEPDLIFVISVAGLLFGDSRIEDEGDAGADAHAGAVLIGRGDRVAD